MFRRLCSSTALVVVFVLPIAAHAADGKELTEIREQIRQLKESYEARIQALEVRVKEAEAKAQAAETKAQTSLSPPPSDTATSMPVAPVQAPAQRSGSSGLAAFNP